MMPEPWIKSVLVIISLSILQVLLCAPHLLALDPQLDVSEYAHTAWKMRDGYFKGPINGIAQTPDGYLWIATEVGIFRFDGVRSALWQPPGGEHLPSNLIIAVLAARNGTLWIGTDKGLASWKDGKLTSYPELAGRWVTALLEDHKGTIWAGMFASAHGGFCQIQNGNARCYGDDGSFGDGFQSLYEDGLGNVWLEGQPGLWQWNEHHLPRRLPLPVEVRSTQALVDDDNGTILFINGIRQLQRGWPFRLGLLNLTTGRAWEYPLPAVARKFEPLHMLRDRSGSLWIGTANQGLLHVHRGRFDTYGASNGLSGDYVRALFEDREGNIWVATINGLDRFHDSAVRAISLKQGLSADSVESVLAANDGSVWLSTYDGLNRWRDGRITIYRKRNGLPDDHTQSLFQDKRGRLWVSTDAGLAYLENGRFIAVNAVTGRTANCIVGDNTGNLWITDQFEGLSRLRGNSIVERIPWDSLRLKSAGASLVVEPERGGIWVGLWDGGLAYFKDHQLRAYYTAADGLGQGHIFGLHLDQHGTVWAATEGGLSRVNSGRLATLTSKNGLPCDTVQWVMPGDDFFWLNMPCGLVRIASPELDAWATDPGRKLQLTIFDNSDGVRTVGLYGSYAPHVTKSTDGKLWFLPGDGVSVIDPRQLPFNNLPPPVHIEQLIADGKAYDTGAAGNKQLRLPPLVRDLTIDFTALSFVVPEKVRFRFKLEGQDEGWREMVNDREVQYTNLAPKHYRFLVKACNNSGVWNEEGAALDFVIPPAWYQTNWFRVLCVVAFLALVWAVYQLRLRQMARQFTMRLEERVGERSRIARDLHDTLLQSFQGLVFRFQAARCQLPDRPEEACEALDIALVSADQALAEGRSAIQELRSEPSKESSLEQMLLGLGRELASSQNSRDTAPTLRVIVEGQRRAKRAMTREEIYRIARELLRNAYRHAHARSIEAELRYDDDAFVLIVRDDGKGIDPNVLKDRGRSGHWGLRGIYERAEGIGARLDVWSQAGVGTEVRLRVPGTIAYEKAGHGVRFKPFRKTRIYERRS